MKITLVLPLLLGLFFTQSMLSAQVTLYSLRGGPTLAMQKWDNFDRDPLIAFHGAVQVESYSEENLRSLYAQLGFHRRGSAIWSRAGNFVNPMTGQEVKIERNTIPFRFNNLALSVGGKQSYLLNNIESYVGFGLRGEYTLSTSLNPSNESFNFGLGNAYPVEEFVNKFIYGIDVTGGLSIPLTDGLEGLVELRISPDLSRQYFQPPIRNVRNPYTGNNENIPERRITNVSLELSIGLRFLPYIDESE